MKILWSARTIENTNGDNWGTKEGLFAWLGLEWWDCLRHSAKWEYQTAVCDSGNSGKYDNVRLTISYLGLAEKIFSVYVT